MATRYFTQIDKVLKSELPSGRKLTSREQEIVHLLYEGYSNKDIGERLGISKRTVEVHRANVMVKVNARNLIELVRWLLGDPKSDEYSKINGGHEQAE